jgi:hypothetical protein
MGDVMADRLAEYDRVVSVVGRVVVSAYEIGEDVTEGTHGNTSNEMSQALRARQDAGWSWDRPAYDGESKRPAGMYPPGANQGQWTVVRSRLAARSSAKRPSCQGVR